MQIRNDIAREDGILLCPEGASTTGTRQLEIKQALVTGDENAILFNLATVLKYSMLYDLLCYMLCDMLCSML